MNASIGLRKDELKQYEAIQNNLCKIRLISCQDNCSPDFTLTEVRQAASELESDRQSLSWSLGNV